MLSLYFAVQTLKTSLTDRLGREETGATAVEYGLMVALIAAVIVGTVLALGETLDGVFDFVEGEISTAAGGE